MEHLIRFAVDNGRREESIAANAACIDVNAQAPLIVRCPCGLWQLTLEVNVPAAARRQDFTGIGDVMGLLQFRPGRVSFWPIEIDDAEPDILRAKCYVVVGVGVPPSVDARGVSGGVVEAIFACRLLGVRNARKHRYSGCGEAQSC